MPSKCSNCGFESEEPAGDVGVEGGRLESGNGWKIVCPECNTQNLRDTAVDNLN